VVWNTNKYIVIHIRIIAQLVLKPTSSQDESTVLCGSLEGFHGIHLMLFILTSNFTIINVTHSIILSYRSKCV
jgi:hypothetical protein